jgi:hypothetical protein
LLGEERIQCHATHPMNVMVLRSESCSGREEAL